MRDFSLQTSSLETYSVPERKHKIFANMAFQERRYLVQQHWDFSLLVSFHLCVFANCRQDVTPCFSGRAFLAQLISHWIIYLTRSLNNTDPFIKKKQVTVFHKHNSLKHSYNNSKFFHIEWTEECDFSSFLYMRMNLFPFRSGTMSRAR